MAVLFYDGVDDAVLSELEKIDDECRSFGIDLVKVCDASVASSYGIDTLPGLLYFENKIPSVYDDGPLDEEDTLLQWLVDQKMTVRHTDTLPVCSERMMI